MTARDDRTARHGGEAAVGVLLDARAAAGVLGISVTMLRTATAAGEIAHVRLRGRGDGARDAVRWLRTDLDAWVEEHRVPAQPFTPPAPRRRAGRRAATPARPAVPRPRHGGPLLSARAVLREVGSA